MSQVVISSRTPSPRSASHDAVICTWPMLPTGTALQIVLSVGSTFDRDDAGVRAVPAHVAVDGRRVALGIDVADLHLHGVVYGQCVHDMLTFCCDHELIERDRDLRVAARRLLGDFHDLQGVGEDDLDALQLDHDQADSAWPVIGQNAGCTTLFSSRSSSQREASS